MSIGIIIVSLKLAMEINTWNVLVHIGLWGSIIFYFMILLAQNYLVEMFPTQYGILNELITQPNFYILTLLCVVAALLPDWTFKYLYRQYRPKTWRLLQEKETLNISNNKEYLLLSNPPNEKTAERLKTNPDLISHHLEENNENENEHENV